MINQDNQKLYIIDTGSMCSWGDLESEQLHQCIDQIEHLLKDSVEIVGLELLLEHTHFDSGSDDETRSSTPVDSIDLTGERNPGLFRISLDVRREQEAPGKAMKRRKPRHAAGGSQDGTECEDDEIDSLILNREKLANIHHDRINRRQNNTGKETREEGPQMAFKYHDRTCPNAFPDRVAMSKPNIPVGGLSCAA